MESLSERIKAFLDPGSGYGYGSGYGDGSGSGYGPGSGSGYGDGSGYGYGSGSGYGYGSGYGSGSGYSDGYGSGSGYGYGSGYGDGSGSGSGYGYGSGYGDGSGYGYGSGYDDGSGYGSGSGLKSYCGHPVYLLDDVQTIIRTVRGNVAKGEIVNSDLTTTPCFIVKQNQHFAHGNSLAEAMSALRDKLFEDMPEEERINAFIHEHALGVKYPCRDLYDWHHRLTGSCDMGRAQFARNHGIDVDAETRTVEEFIELTRNAYGGGVIRHLEAAYRRTEPPKEET